MQITNLTVKREAKERETPPIKCPLCGWPNYFIVDVASGLTGEAEEKCHSCGSLLAFIWHLNVGMVNPFHNKSHNKRKR